MNQKPDKFIPALYGGIIMGLISSIPFLNLVNCLCCAGVLLGGFLAVMFYKKNFTADSPPFNSADCLAVGTMAGVVGAFVGTILSLIFAAIFGDVARELLLNLLKNSSLQFPPDLLDKIEESIREGRSGFRMVFQFGSSLVIDTIFGLLGGLIGYSILKPKELPPPQMPLPPPMAPPS
ncbi:MAG TPA: hypothetical protein VI215_03295 [Bacteroidota bacterium]|jgi:hypothetical protein